MPTTKCLLSANLIESQNGFELRISYDSSDFTDDVGSDEGLDLAEEILMRLSVTAYNLFWTIS